MIPFIVTGDNERTNATLLMADCIWNVYKPDLADFKIDSGTGLARSHGVLNHGSDLHLLVVGVYILYHYILQKINTFTTNIFTYRETSTILNYTFKEELHIVGREYI